PDPQPTLEATGDATTDTVTILVDVGSNQLDPSTRPQLIDASCASSSLRWATGQGLELANRYVDDAGNSIEWTMNEELCQDVPVA
ncbi:MAG: hypothetical protein AAFO29_13515, partial [Actinomycetota bacterium]